MENKKLQIEITPEVLSVLTNFLYLKHVCGDYTLDACGDLTLLILKAIEAGKPTLLVRRAKSC